MLRVAPKATQLRSVARQTKSLNVKRSTARRDLNSLENSGASRSQISTAKQNLRKANANLIAESSNLLGKTSGGKSTTVSSSQVESGVSTASGILKGQKIDPKNPGAASNRLSEATRNDPAMKAVDASGKSMVETVTNKVANTPGGEAAAVKKIGPERWARIKTAGKYFLVAGAIAGAFFGIAYAEQQKNSGCFLQIASTGTSKKCNSDKYDGSCDACPGTLCTNGKCGEMCECTEGQTCICKEQDLMEAVGSIFGDVLDVAESVGGIFDGIIDFLTTYLPYAVGVVVALVLLTLAFKLYRYSVGPKSDVVKIEVLEKSPGKLQFGYKRPKLSFPN